MRVSTAVVKHLSPHCSQLKPGRRLAASSGKPEPSSHGASEAFLTQLVTGLEPSLPWAFGPLWLQAPPLSCPISGCFMLPLVQMLEEKQLCEKKCFSSSAASALSSWLQAGSQQPGSYASLLHRCAPLQRSTNTENR